MDEPINTIEVNHEATRNVLRSALKNKARVIIASSSEVYGANSNLIFSEDDICMIGPTSHRRWCYSASKLLDEFHGLAYFYEKKLPVTIVRLFNTIGERQAGSYGMVVPTLIKQALAGEPITVFGTGEQKRCFTYVGDVANSLYLLACSDKAHGQVFNIGSTNEISINDLAKKIKFLTNSSSSIIHKGYKEAYGEDFKDIERRYPDVSRLLNTIGYQPETPLDEALQKIIYSIKN
jgi:UDP-glucose 4-epimerase